MAGMWNKKKKEMSGEVTAQKTVMSFLRLKRFDLNFLKLVGEEEEDFRQEGWYRSRDTKKKELMLNKFICIFVIATRHRK